jgi:precorrin-2 dehydrogenase/sirohydrochlorin ferrochelatase
MADYPICLQLQDQLCVVVGAGPVGLRKLAGLRRAGARIRLIAPDAPASLAAPDLELCRRPYQSGDLAGAALAFVATSDPTLNAAIAREARAAGVLVNVADAPAEGSFTLPALFRQGGWTLALSSGGASPALCALVRDRLADALGPDWGTLLEIAAALRQKRLTPLQGSQYNQQVLRRLLDRDLPALIAAGDAAAVDDLLAEICGPGCSLSVLGVHLP